MTTKTICLRAPIATTMETINEYEADGWAVRQLLQIVDLHPNTRPCVLVVLELQEGMNV